MKGYQTALNNHAASVIELYDENCDGALDKDEFFKSQLQEDNLGMEFAFRALDTNKSGKLEQNEVAKFHSYNFR